MKTQMTADSLKIPEPQIIADRANISGNQRLTNFQGISGHRRRGQAVLEYATFIAVVAAAILAMQLYVRRAIQANLKTLEEQINAGAIP